MAYPTQEELKAAFSARQEFIASLKMAQHGRMVVNLYPSKAHELFRRWDHRPPLYKLYEGFAKILTEMGSILGEKQPYPDRYRLHIESESPFKACLVDLDKDINDPSRILPIEFDTDLKKWFVLQLRNEGYVPYLQFDGYREDVDSFAPISHRKAQLGIRQYPSVEQKRRALPSHYSRPKRS
jgi:hypothetical protein